MTDARLVLLRELERADEALSAELTELDELYAATEAARARALELEAFAEQLPRERAERQTTLEEAEREHAAAEHAAARAAEELREAEAGDDRERVPAARRFEVRARDARATAERRAREAREALEALEAEAAAAEQELPRLEARVAALAASLADHPRLGPAGGLPAPGPAGVAEWATRARAALLVARSQVAAEREAVIRQSNELGSLLLGEQLGSTRASEVARLVESSFGRR